MGGVSCHVLVLHPWGISTQQLLLNIAGHDDGVSWLGVLPLWVL